MGESKWTGRRTIADLYPKAREILSRLPNLIDPNKPSNGDLDDADPYVVAHGLDRRENGYEGVTIITDDYHTKPAKTSLSDAAGVFLLPTVTLRIFLVTEGIWDGKKGL